MAAWLNHTIPALARRSVTRQFTKKLPYLQPWAAAALLFSTRLVFGNVVAMDDLDSACVPWRRSEAQPGVWLGPPLHSFWAAGQAALGRLGAARGSTPPWLHPPIHRPRPCFAWSIAPLAGRLQLKITAVVPDHPVVADPV